MANNLRPDLAVLTGDYISHSRDYIAGCARALGRLRAAHGVFAVLGNHDHWTDGDMMHDALSGQGIRVLCNESTRVEKNSVHIRIAGVDDMMVRLDDLSKALEETTSEEARILLSHNPAIIRFVIFIRCLPCPIPTHHCRGGACAARWRRRATPLHLAIDHCDSTIAK